MPGIAGAIARPATAYPALPAGRARALAGSAKRRSPAEDWRRHGRRCIRLNRSGISPRCSVGACSNGVNICWCKLKSSWRPGFQRAALNEGICPSPQRWNVNVDPILPPVERACVIRKLISFLGNESVGELLDIICGEVVLVKQNKGLKQLDQLFDSLK